MVRNMIIIKVEEVVIEEVPIMSTLLVRVEVEDKETNMTNSRNIRRRVLRDHHIKKIIHLRRKAEEKIILK
jgi:hypothetical protein